MYKKTTGKPKEKDGFDSKLLELKRVSHTRAGGKKMRFRACVIVGNKNGKVGLGVASGLDVQIAVEKATRLAKRHIIDVIIKNGTIPCDTEAKFGSASILFRPQAKGRGLVVGGPARVVCTLAGIKDVSSKVIGRNRNKLNNATAALNALRAIGTFSKITQGKKMKKEVEEVGEKKEEIKL
ncbi:30S ribosomal protein S5 [Candidatus Parcubacteria bacterium A4]|nr:MAG: 30S ribosomal protein S5 [Candidatus Parcubacteria bacterium A4]